MSKDDEVIFRIVARPGLAGSRGTRLFVMGNEIPLIEKMKVETDYGDSESIPKTTLTITVAGSQVMTEFIDDPERMTFTVVGGEPVTVGGK